MRATESRATSEARGPLQHCAPMLCPPRALDARSCRATDGAMEDERDILPIMTLHRGRPRVSHELDSQRYCNAALQCESRRLYGTAAVGCGYMR